MTSPITTHVLDISRGKPAVGIKAVLEVQSGSNWKEIGRGTTNDDGRIADLLDSQITPGLYRLTFATAEYFRTLKTESFYPKISIEFEIKNSDPHYHVPLLLSPFGYSTYKGS